MTNPKAQPEAVAAGDSHSLGELILEGADSRAVERWLARTALSADLSIERGAVEESKESYLDTDDGRLLRLGFCLRLTEQNGIVVATLEPIACEASPGSGWCETLTPGGRSLLEEEDRLFDGRLRCLKGERPLGRRVEVLSHLQSVAIRRVGGAGCEMTLERMIISLAGSAAHHGAVRLKLRADPAGDATATMFVEELGAACPLQPSSAPRAQAAFAKLGLGPPGPPEVGPDRIERSQTVAEAAYAVLRRHFRCMLAEEAGTRLGEDSEALHDMRVAIRRQRAALRLFRASLPPRVGSLRTRLRRIASALGEVRDLDVHLGTLEECRGELEPPDRAALEVLRTRLMRSRDVARRKVLRTLDGPRYGRLVEHMTGVLRRGPSRRFGPGRPPVRLQAPGLISERYDRVMKLARKIGARSAAPEFHRLRIRCKALRYALEFHVDLYGRPAKRVIRDLVSLQDLLGEHQDVIVAATWLRGLVEERGARLGAATAFVAGRLAERYERRARRLRRKFPKLLKPIAGRRWLRLQETMQGEAVAAAVASPHRMQSSRAFAGPTEDRLRDLGASDQAPLPQADTDRGDR